MLLKDYSYADYPKKSKVFVSEEMEELKTSIKDFFNNFSVAVKLDNQSNLKEDTHKLMFLLTNKDDLRGLAHYLLDFQGTHDTFFHQSEFDLRSLSYMVFTYKLPFDHAHYRLLDLSEAHIDAILLPDEDNVADWILSHINKYEEIELVYLFRALKKMKDAFEEDDVDFSDAPSQYMLYNYIKKRVSFFKLYFKL